MNVASFLLPLFISLWSLVGGYDEAELVFVGDAMQHVAQRDAAHRPDGTYDFSQCFEQVKPIVESADYAVVNLETPVGPGPYSGYPCFNAPPSYVDALSDAGFDLFLTANNHTLDRGPRGLRATIAELDRRGLAHVGTYSDDSARTAALPLLRTVENIRFGFLNYTYGTNGINPRDGVVVDYIDRDLIADDVERTRSAGAEIIVVCIHWGDEYHLLPNAAQRSLAEYLESLGVDMIIGGHPHVIQPMELRANRYLPGKNVFLVYSLGNFISNMKKPDTRGGAMARVLVRRLDNGVPTIVEAGYRLLFTVPGTSPDNNFHVVEVRYADDRRAAAFAESARRIFDIHNIAVDEIR